MDLLPGFPFGISRLDLLNNTWNLLADFPFTGGGLRAFPGLYSEYILHIPYLFLEYSHHLYMDIALEQGAVGFFSFMVVIFGSLLLVGALVIKNEEPGQAFYMQLAVIAGLVVTIIHGLIDNPLYGMQGTPLLFLVPGIGAALYKKDISSPVELNEKVGLLKYWPLRGSLLFGLFFLILMNQSVEKAVSAAWVANLGSIYMSKAELANFPANSFDVLPDRESYSKARGYFLQALDKDPMNTTANYRLGLMSSQDLDFATAIPYLERAHEVNSGHRGIQKALGYNYVWTDRPEPAAELLVEIPEARYELEVYAWWWETRGRPDLAAKSQTALGYLKAD
jgi:tetratricopeptide (TPR) repeat protein